MSAMTVPKTISCIDSIVCRFGTLMTSYRNMQKKRKDSYVCVNIWSKSLSLLELTAAES